MKCPKCNEEIEDNSAFCQSCGEKLNDKSSINCPNCGELLKSNVNFCSNCGYNFKNGKNIYNVTYRSPEFILGIIGSTIGFLTLISEELAHYTIQGYLSDWLYYIAPLIGFIGTLYLLKDRRNGAIVMLVSSFLFLYLPFSTFGFKPYNIACFFVGFGGLLALFKK